MTTFTTQDRQDAQRATFKEFPVGNFVMRFYKTDHVWTCTVNEDVLDAVIKIAKPLSEEQIQAEWERLGSPAPSNAPTE